MKQYDAAAPGRAPFAKRLHVSGVRMTAATLTESE